MGVKMSEHFKLSEKDMDSIEHQLKEAKALAEYHKADRDTLMKALVDILNNVGPVDGTLVLFIPIDIIALVKKVVNFSQLSRKSQE